MKNNFETIQRADDDGNLALLESHCIADGKTVYLICGIMPPEEGDDEGTYNITPFAEMIDGNPFELYEPPIGEDEVGETPEDPDDTLDGSGDPTRTFSTESNR